LFQIIQPLAKFLVFLFQFGHTGCIGCARLCVSGETARNQGSYDRAHGSNGLLSRVLVHLLCFCVLDEFYLAGLPKLACRDFGSMAQHLLPTVLVRL
jgi:hypothetical protein